MSDSTGGCFCHGRVWGKAQGERRIRRPCRPGRIPGEGREAKAVPGVALRVVGGGRAVVAAGVRGVESWAGMAGRTPPVENFLCSSITNNRQQKMTKKKGYGDIELEKVRG